MSRASAAGAVIRGWRPLLRSTRAHAVIIAVLAVYAASALIVHPGAPVAISDDWAYFRSVEILFAHHTLRILPVTVTTLVFQVLWGSLFAKVLGLSFAATRASTVALSLVGGGALYGLCRELGVSRGRSALGATLYLFNPLSYVLAFTFMSDAGFCALLTVATWLLVRAMRGPTPAIGALALGSAVGGLAFLQRQQAALIPVAVVTYLLVARRLRVDGRSAAVLAAVTVPQGLVMAGYYLWLFTDHGVPLYQRLFLQHVTEGGVGGAALMGARMTLIEPMYVGLFALPLLAGAVAGLRRVVGSVRTWGWVVVGALAAALVVGAVRFGDGRARMPYIPDFVNASGLGPVQQLRGSRPALVGRGALTFLTVLCTASVLVLALALVSRVADTRGRRPGAVGLVASVAAWQAVGALPPSFSFRLWHVGGLPSPSLDRYLLPLLPLVIALGLWAWEGRGLWLPGAWLATALVGVFAVAGTRDSMVRQEAVWRLADSATAVGAPRPSVDGGAAWMGYHLYDYCTTHDDGPTAPGSPWWIYVFAPGCGGTYVVAGAPLPGFDVVRTVRFSSWLEPGTPRLWLLRRRVAGPSG